MIYAYPTFHRAIQDAASPVYWFLMQIGMIAGFFTAWPANAWLIRAGIKESMWRASSGLAHPPRPSASPAQLITRTDPRPPAPEKGLAWAIA